MALIEKAKPAALLYANKMELNIPLGSFVLKRVNNNNILMGRALILLSVLTDFSNVFVCKNTIINTVLISSIFLGP
jgi:hypothetical protein